MAAGDCWQHRQEYQFWAFRGLHGKFRLVLSTCRVHVAPLMSRRLDEHISWQPLSHWQAEAQLAGCIVRTQITSELSAGHVRQPNTLTAAPVLYIVCASATFHRRAQRAAAGRVLPVRGA
jgi:hypothetical protein